MAVEEEWTGVIPLMEEILHTRRDKEDRAGGPGRAARPGRGAGPIFFITSRPISRAGGPGSRGVTRFAQPEAPPHPM